MGKNNIYSRNFKIEANDFKKLYNYIINDNKIRKNNFIWHIARLVDWKYNLLNHRKLIPSNFEDYTRLWFNKDNELIGFVLSEGMDNSFQVFVKEDYKFLYKEMISWFLNTFAEKYREFDIVINENQKYEKSIIESLGFDKTDHREITYAIKTKEYADYEYKIDNIEIQNMKENPNYSLLMELRKNVWPNGVDNDLEVSIREYIRKSPIYRDDFNFVLVNEEGLFISGCEAFIDKVNNTSEIERVCTHKNHWNNGYSKMILKTALKKLYEKGIDTAYLTGWDNKTMHLYSSLGHHQSTIRSNYNLHIEN